MRILGNVLLLSAAMILVQAGPATAQGNPPVLINELLASNTKSAMDAQGQYDDWIELYNAGGTAVDVGGMYLTDELATPSKWRIPTGAAAQTTIPSHGFLFVWADKDVTAAGLHAGFSLDAGGEDLALYGADGVTLIDSVTFGPQRADVTYGRFPDGAAAWSLLDAPSPGGANIRFHQGYLDKPRFSPGHGFYSSPVVVTLACDVPGATIYYTVDGGEPYSAATGRINTTAELYSKPLQVSRTTCLRAIALCPDWWPSPIETQTYLFVADVIKQSPAGQAPGASWPSAGINGQVFDYGMDPDVVNNALYKDLMDDAMLSIPSMSLVTPLGNLFDPAKGIYVNASREGPSWERPVSVELIRPDGGEGFQIDAGLRIRGGFSRGGSNPKHSFRLFFRPEYGAPSLKYPLFDSEGADEFENIDLRTSQNYAWSLDSSNPGEKNTFVREEFCRDLQRETGRPYTRTRYYHLYLNGQYWGLYETQERSEASYAATYFGGEADDYDTIMTDGYRTSYTDGTIDEWNLLWGLCQQGFESDAAYYAVQGKRPDGTDDPALPVRVDLDNLTDYMIGIFYTGNDDAPVSLGGGSANNFFAIRNRNIEARDGWKFFAYDNEHSLGVRSGVNDDRTATVSAGQSRDHFNPQWLHQKLMVHPEYCLHFADHVHKHFFNGGVMTPDKAIALCMSRANELDLAIIAESARWGDARPSRAANPYTKTDWWTEVNGYLVKTYFPVRTGIVLNQFRARGLYPRVEAPVFQINSVYTHGGAIASADRLSMTGGGALWYTLDGSDPRVPGTTAAPANAVTLVADGAAKRAFIPVGPINETWRGGQGFDDSGWIPGSGGVGFERSSGFENYFKIDVQGQMYGRNTTCCIRIPFAVSAADFAGLASLALKVRCDDGFVAWLNGVEIARKNFTGNPVWNSAANATNADTDAVNFEEFDVTAQMGALREAGNILAIQAMNNTTTSSDFLLGVELVSSQSAGGAPSGVSPTAVRYTQATVLPRSACVKARALSGTVWSALNEATFAVGPVAQSLRVSEIMYHPPDTGDPNDPNAEYIELTNIGGQAVNVNLVRFIKGIDFTFADVVLAPAAYVLVVKNRGAFESRYGAGLPIAGEYSGSLSNSGERVELQDALGTTIQSFTYEDSWYATTDGRGYSLTAVDPQTADPNAWSDKSAWRSSRGIGGSPGRSD